RTLGYTVVPQVGCSGFRIDLGIVDPAAPGRFLLGVECDGATYHSAATARDRDRLRQQILEQLGWRIHRIWSPDWVTKRGGEISTRGEALEEARRRDSQDTALVAVRSDADDADSQQPILDVERVAVAPANADTVLPGTVPYELYEMDVAYHD